MTQKIKYNTRFVVKTRRKLNDSNKPLVQEFINAFMSCQISPLEIRVTAQQVRDFLLSHDSAMSLTTFNRLTVCLGRTSGNRYAYSVPVLLSIAEPGPMLRPLGSKHFPSTTIKTIDHYGSKRSWSEEYRLIMRFVSDTYECSTLVDSFGGSGFISLLASSLNLFKNIFLNEGSTSVFNFHSVMKSELHFTKFAKLLAVMPVINAKSFYLIRENFYVKRDSANKPDVKSFEGRELRRQLQSIDVRKALQLFIIKHFAFQCQGGFATTRPPISKYVAALARTHELYGNITLTNYHYRKHFSGHLNQSDSFIILDPPYLKNLRVQKQSYELEFTSRQHRSMLQLLSRCDYPAKILLCGYKDDENDFYSRYLQHAPTAWHCVKFLRSSRNIKSRPPKECVWVNFDLLPLCNEYPHLFQLVF